MSLFAYENIFSEICLRMKPANTLTLRCFLAALLVVATGCGPKSRPPIDQEANAAWDLLRSGDDASAMEAMLHLSDEYHRRGDFDNESISLFCAAQVYLQQMDTVGMRSILSKMETLASAHPDLPNVVYSYHTVRQTLFAILFQQAGREEDRDMMLSEGARAIALMEGMSLEELKRYRVNPVWNYYNMAVGYDMYFDPPVRDSIAYYLDKAREANSLDYDFAPNVHMEGDISIGDEQAWLYYYDGQYDKAEGEMLRVLEMIDSVEVKTPNVVLTERVEAYSFLVELYSHTGRMDKALRYEQLKGEADMRRLGVERNEAVHQVEARFDVAREQAKVERMRWIVGLLCCVILLLGGAVLYLHLWRRNRLEMQYSAAVEALVSSDDKVGALTGNVPAESAAKLFSSALKPLTAVERKYILLLMSGKSTGEIASAMNVEPSSVYTMKYRIKKKFPPDFPLPF